ncbi:polysaccharide lyase 6 family protein [Shewanella donghaensis]|uniref:polysaccharide lyase 6 family protein n=1 Tax=Shewanella donghaensis TaxID=238836 RepID=UPI001D036DBB|nr:polysaccharide lyase 6 family protein [Shewanella donghaensis]
MSYLHTDTSNDKKSSKTHYTLNNIKVAFALSLTASAIMPLMSANAATYTVKNPVEYNKTAKKLVAGDEVILADGVWQDFEIKFKGQGTKDAPIKLSAQTKGKVILSGQSNLRLSGKYLEVSGLVFKNGYTPSNEVIAFRTSKNDLANHSRVSEVVIDNYSNPDRHESDYWVSLYGKNNQFDHNHLVGKRNKGVTMAVRLKGEDSQENHHKIDHNYFGPRPILGSNGGETLRIGTSHYSMSDSFTLVENNYFDRCDGEVEIISVKSGKNTLRNNTFFESRGTLTMRHGNGNKIEGNVFLGNGVDHTGGIRVINRDQTITNNYLEGLKGYRFGSGFTIMNGVPNSPINRYHQVVNADVNHNSFIDVEHIHLAAGSDQERSATPQKSTFSDNLVFNKNQQAPFSLFDDISGIQFSNNVSNDLSDNKIEQGFTVEPIALTRAENGLMYPTDKALRQYGATTKLSPTTKAQTGVSWYPKDEPETTFGSGNEIKVSSTEQLITAIEQANSGDTIELADGSYDIEKIIFIDKAITVQALNTKKAKLTFSRPTLFEIQNGGALKLDGLIITGENSLDSSGNTVIRTSKWGMLTNYRFSMFNSEIKQLDINHSFHFFDSGSRAFAKKIEIINNNFEKISGDIFRLNKETDDLGIYNAEYLIVENNQFKNIEGALVNLYRGGTDESTFGPHLSFMHNEVSNVGQGKRNKSKASLFLHGVQVTDIEKNSFKDSAVVKIEHTTGEPVTQVSNNQFINAGSPSVQELYAIEKTTASITNNKVQ